MSNQAYNGPVVKRKPSKPMTASEVAKAKEADKQFGQKKDTRSKKK